MAREACAPQQWADSESKSLEDEATTGMGVKYDLNIITSAGEGCCDDSSTGMVWV
jgi:hypothetical protein